MSNTISSNPFNSNSIFGGSSSIGGISIAKTTSKDRVYGDYKTFDVINMRYGRNSAPSAATATYQNSVTNKKDGSDLASALSKLTAQNGKSTFSAVAATSDNTKAATATVDGSKTDGKVPDAVELDIAQVAKTQVNSSDSGMVAAGKDLSSGSFQVTVGDKQATLKITVGSTDTNESIQKKMAQAINDQKMGVVATVAYDAKTKTSKLSVESAATGNKGDDSDPVFTIKDVDTGTLAAKTGITNTSQKAQNAVYRVNSGDVQTSTSNNVDVGHGVTATLKDTASSVKLTFKKDTSASVNAAQSLVSTINSILSSNSGQDTKGAQRLQSDIASMNKTYSGSLSVAGINVAKDGTLSIDSKKLQAAADNGSLERLFQKNTFGSNTGFANRANNMASAMKYDNYYSDSAPNTSSYSSKYSSAGSMGSMFDSLF